MLRVLDFSPLKLLSTVLIYLNLILLILIFPFSLRAQNEETSIPSKSAASPAKGKDGKPTAYMGDPSQKRGFELGYDYGVKAGKTDKKLGKKQNPTGHEDYALGTKRYRSEYGNQGRFVSGYQAGFMRGYKSGFSREQMDPQATKKYQEEEKKQKSTESRRKEESMTSEAKRVPSSTSTAAPPKPKPKRFDPAQDAL